MPDLAWPGAADLIPQATQPAQFADMDPQILQKNHKVVFLVSDLWFEIIWRVPFSYCQSDAESAKDLLHQIAFPSTG